jgi:hypothetical protein
MGCKISSPQNQAAIEQEMVIVPFLNSQPRSIPHEDYHANSYFPFESFSQNLESRKRRVSCDRDMIDYSSATATAEPDSELYKKQKFNECFSHIEVSTFQNVPIMSVQSLINVPSIENQQSDSFNVHDYYELIDQVVSKIVPPLISMKVNTDYQFTM